MGKTTQFSEVKIDHIDDNGVAHIDSYRTDDDNEQGQVLGYIVNGEVYWKVDPEVQFDPMVKGVLQDFKVEMEVRKDKEYEGRRKLAKNGEDVANRVSDFVNTFSIDVDGFVDKFLRTHNTLQQSMVSLFFKCIEAMAKVEYVDPRNAASKQVCQMVLKAYQEQVVFDLVSKGMDETKAREWAENERNLPSNLPLI